MVRWTLRICAIALVALMLVGAVNGFAENRRFNASAKTALVEPITEYNETTTTKKKLFVTISETKSYSTRIFFVTGDNRRIGVDKDLSQDLLERFRRGEEVFIHYLPDEPTMTRFPGEGPSPSWSLVFALVVLGITYLSWKPKGADGEGTAQADA